MDAYIFSTPEKQIELGLNAEQLTQFNTYKTQYNTSFAAYLDPAKRTKVITQQIHDDYQQIHRWIAELRQIIKTNKKATLTDQDYASMFIHKDKTTRTKHTKPKTAPNLELEHIEHLNARISAHHATSHDQGTRPSLPEGIDLLDWQWAITPEQTPNVIYSEHKTTQSATLNLDFTPDKVGQFCHLSARYGITSGEVGTYSTNFSFAIT